MFCDVERYTMDDGWKHTHPNNIDNVEFMDR